jgi:hypothetical protein
VSIVVARPGAGCKKRAVEAAKEKAPREWEFLWAVGPSMLLIEALGGGWDAQQLLKL